MNYNQDNWVDFLLIIKFALNSDINTSIGLLPFIITKGYTPRSGIKLLTLFKNLPSLIKKDIKTADDFI